MINLLFCKIYITYVLYLEVILTILFLLILNVEKIKSYLYLV